MIKASAQVENARDVKVTMAFTMTLGEWEAIEQALSSAGYHSAPDRLSTMVSKQLNILRAKVCELQEYSS